MFFASAGLTCALNIDDRKEGLWNRSVLAGVRTTEFFFCVIVTAFVISILTLSAVVLALFITDMRCEGSYLMVLAFLVLICLSGLFLGLFVASCSQSHMISCSLFMCLTNCANYLMGNFTVLIYLCF